MRRVCRWRRLAQRAGNHEGAGEIGPELSRTLLDCGVKRSYQSLPPPRLSRPRYKKWARPRSSMAVHGHFRGSGIRPVALTQVGGQTEPRRSSSPTTEGGGGRRPRGISLSATTRAKATRLAPASPNEHDARAPRSRRRTIGKRLRPRASLAPHDGSPLMWKSHKLNYFFSLANIMGCRRGGGGSSNSFAHKDLRRRSGFKSEIGCRPHGDCPPPNPLRREELRQKLGTGMSSLLLTIVQNCI